MLLSLENIPEPNDDSFSLDEAEDGAAARGAGGLSEIALTKSENMPPNVDSSLGFAGAGACGRGRLAAAGTPAFDPGGFGAP